jgi:gluconolactonase
LPTRSLLRQFAQAAMLCAVWASGQSSLFSQAVANPADQAAVKPSNDYPLGPDSLPHPGVPLGQTFEFRIEDSKTFPNTSRTISVYVPAQYRESEAACVYVGFDGLGFNAPVVFDNLIARHAMPVTIAVGIAPGTVAAANAAGSPRFDRSFEFDSRTDRLATFVLDEVLPAVEQKSSSDGRRIHLSTNPDCRMIGGSSTGGIAAFNVAWQRPDAFHRVFSSIGTFVGMRGAESFYVEVRKTEPKPIRVFLQDGAYDQWPGGPEMGDWWMSNQTMERALTFAGYDVRHVWGLGTHNGAHAAAIFPDAMQWLWRDWPLPIVAGTSLNPALQAVVEPALSWQIASEDCPAKYLAANPDGRIFYSGLQGKPVELTAGTCTAAAKTPLAFGADGTAYTAGGGALVRWNRNVAKTLANHLGEVRDVTVDGEGDLYATLGGSTDGSVLLIRSDGRSSRVATSLRQPSGLALSPDKAWLFVAQQDGRNGYSLRVKSDGTLDSAEPLFDFFVPASSVGSQAHSIAMDKDGRAYAATTAGVQVFDHNGRVVAILPLPSNRPAVSLCFGGPDFQTLYVSDGVRVYKRSFKVKGAPSWMPASTVPNWGAG